MAWHTVVQTMSIGGTDVTFATVEPVLKSMFEHHGTHPDVLEGLRSAFETGEGVCNVHPSYVQDVFSQIVPLITEGHLDVRCLGEEFRDTWIMSIADGSILFSEGPWDPE